MILCPSFNLSTVYYIRDAAKKSKCLPPFCPHFISCFDERLLVGSVGYTLQKA
jgi:hypothetical protein